MVGVRQSLLTPCHNAVHVSQRKDIQSECDDHVFKRTKEGNKSGLSNDDREFLAIMKDEFEVESSGKWTAPLPFRADRPKLSNNRVATERRAKMLDYNLRRDEHKMKMFTEFVGNVIETGHAELAPTLSPVQKYWYLQVFGVTHPQKPDQIRCVFDSSAKHENLSLNGVLLTGPDLTNSLLGVLVSFRREAVAITADIQQMFYCFNVSEDHMNYLRFLWNKDLSNSLVEYRMCVQVFGNSPSPAIVTYEKISGTQ